MEEHHKRIDEAKAELEELQNGFRTFWALHCPCCQGGGCPVCAGSGFVFGNSIAKSEFEVKSCEECKFCYIESKKYFACSQKHGEPANYKCSMFKLK